MMLWKLTYGKACRSFNTKKTSTTPQRVQILDNRGGMEKRGLYSSLLKDHGQAVCNQRIEILDLDEAAELKKYITSKIVRMRWELRVQPVFLSGLLTQAGKSQSQFYSGHCLRCQNNMPFRSVSYSLKRVQK